MNLYITVSQILISGESHICRVMGSQTYYRRSNFRQKNPSCPQNSLQNVIKTNWIKLGKQLKSVNVLITGFPIFCTDKFQDFSSKFPSSFELKSATIDFHLHVNKDWPFLQIPKYPPSNLDNAVCIIPATGQGIFPGLMPFPQDLHLKLQNSWCTLYFLRFSRLNGNPVIMFYEKTIYLKFLVFLRVSVIKSYFGNSNSKLNSIRCISTAANFLLLLSSLLRTGITSPKQNLPAFSLLHPVLKEMIKSLAKCLFYLQF